MISPLCAQPKGIKGRFISPNGYVPRPWMRKPQPLVKRKKGETAIAQPKGVKGRFISPNGYVPRPWMRRPKPPEVIERIVSLYVSGLTSREIAAQTGFNLSHVKTVVKQAGVSRPAGFQKGHKSHTSVPANLFESYAAQYREGARTRGLPYQLTLVEFTEIVTQQCFYCGAQPRPRRFWSRTLNGNGVDRVDNSLGYITSNVVPCCTLCNLMKAAEDAESFVEHCKKVAAYKTTTVR